MARGWMPLYIGDYLADTRRLSTLEHGAYMLLIMDYWRNGSLPIEDEKLARIAGIAEPEVWQCVRNAIAPLFRKNWTHKRIDKELKIALSKSIKASESAGKRWKNKTKGENANAYAMAMPTDMPSECYHNHSNILDSSVPSESNNRPGRASSKTKPIEVLKTVLSEQTALDLLEHRKSKRSPLTARAAEGLVRAFREFGDPEAAAETMITRGWVGFKPDWINSNATRAVPRGNGTVEAMRRFYDKHRSKNTNDYNGQRPGPASPDDVVQLSRLEWEGRGKGS